MRGSPLFRAVLMAAALLALIIPLRSLTFARSAAPVMPAAAKTAATRAHLQITSTVVPFTFSVSHLGKAIWQGTATASPAETERELAFPPEGIDFVLEAKWSPARTAAVKLGVARGDDEPGAQTVWGEGAVNEVLTFK